MQTTKMQTTKTTNYQLILGGGVNYQTQSTKKIKANYQNCQLSTHFRGGGYIYMQTLPKLHYKEVTYQHSSNV